MFVQRSGTRLVFDGDPFFAEGFNCYFLSFCSDAIRRATLEAAKQLGANTLRSWAFLDRAAPALGEPAFQYLNGDTVEQNDGPDGLERLDHLIATAEQLNLKLILPVVNYWPDFGGMPMYLHWLGLPEDDPAEFYRSSRARNTCKSWIGHVLSRRNVFTGRRYFEEPAVLAWELANEPRCTGPGGRQLLLDWVEDMSLFVKERNPNHLLAVGDEGFFCRRGRSHLYNGTYGVDFEALLALPAIDFGTFHMYIQHWGESADSHFPKRWIRDHIEAGSRAGKPVVLEEFGILCDEAPEMTDESRRVLYRDWTTCMRGEGGAGALAWMLGNDSPETARLSDKYTIYGPSQTPPAANT
ncbi:MAG: cellulase family glycosylhydrolase [Bryobacteraceae bacterium]